jgi:Pyruvate/2-oxoacid:ferredoxin oxidoreductase delta subunit
VGVDISFDELRKRHDAIFVATGAHRSRTIGLGTSQDGPIWSGLRFLDRVNQGTDPDIGRRAVIVGGGNTAIDTARVALRLGAEPYIIYRRTREEMPAHDTEIEDAEKEGIQFTYLATPIAVEEAGRQLRVTFNRMKLGEAGQDGRRRPQAIPGDTFKLTVDTLIEAVGEEPDLKFLGNYSEKDGIFIGGDAFTGPSTVVDAIAGGKEIARRIRKYLGYNGKESGKKLQLGKFDRETLNYEYFPTIRPTAIPKLPVQDRNSNFEEIVGTLETEGAVQEAHRCMSCGVCNSCDTCYIHCPEAAISRNGSSYSINLDYCKGCGICAQECPRGVITLIQEEL